MDWWYDWEKYDCDNDKSNDKVPTLIRLLGLIYVVFNREHDSGGRSCRIVIDMVFSEW